MNPQAWQVWDKGPLGAAVYGNREGAGQNRGGAADSAARETKIKPGMKGWKEGKDLEGILCFVSLNMLSASPSMSEGQDYAI